MAHDTTCVLLFCKVHKLLETEKQDVICGYNQKVIGPEMVKAITFSIADGIASPLSETEEGVIYDLSGRRVEKATKGIYIINGKKVLK